MSDLKRVEELTKALQEGKTLMYEGFKAQMVNGFLTIFYANSEPTLNGAIHLGCDWQIQEPEPEFKITENQLAEYKCSNGRTLITNGIKKYTTYCGILNDGTSITTLRKDGNTDGSVTVIHKIRDL